MKNVFLCLLMAAVLAGCAAKTNQEDLMPQMDKYQTPIGDLYVTVLGHGSLMMKFFVNVIYVDPFSEVADYKKLPKADLVLITHNHYDHLDLEALKPILKPETRVIAPAAAAEQLKTVVPNVEVLNNGGEAVFKHINIEALPAYNIENKKPDGSFYHPKGVGNGYMLGFDFFKFYVAGDTEFTPEMAKLKDIYCAFLPKNLPYTMSDEMFIKAAKTIKPQFLYPYHYDTVDKVALQKAVGAGIKIK